MEFERVVETAKFIVNQLNIQNSPKVGVICGSGLSALADCLTKTASVRYEQIPNFPLCTVEGHDGLLVYGFVGRVPVICMKGRFHLYEGYTPELCSAHIRVMKHLGVSAVIITNAAGGINNNFNVGDVMIVLDHISLPGMAGINPLRGQNDDRFGVRFPSMSRAYDQDLVKLAKACFSKLQLSDVAREGVYVSTAGPSYETPSEIRILKLLGADAVGMSTTYEATVARHCGLRVLGLSLISNTFKANEEPNHEEVVSASAKRVADLRRFLEVYLKNFE